MYQSEITAWTQASIGYTIKTAEMINWTGFFIRFKKKSENSLWPFYPTKNTQLVSAGFFMFSLKEMPSDILNSCVGTSIVNFDVVWFDFGWLGIILAQFVKTET